jgi:predicted transcriptional regulator
MKTTATFTSTISPELIAWVDMRAKTQKQTRRAVLEEAIKNYQRDATKKRLAEGFARAAHDADIIELSEWGFGDYTHLTGRT